MGTLVWILVCSLHGLFWTWVVFLGGADRLEGTLASGCLISIFAPRWSAEGIRLFGLLMLVGTAIWFIIGLIDPAARPLGTVSHGVQ